MSEDLCSQDQFTVFICPEDVSNEQSGVDGDDVVNGRDLLAIILTWGPCASGGAFMPESISDCFNDVCAGLEGEEWQRCIDACIHAVCEKNPSECE